MPVGLYSENLNNHIFQEPGSFIDGTDIIEKIKSIIEKSMAQNGVVHFFLETLWFFPSMTSFSFENQDICPHDKQLYKIRCLEKYMY